jgi:hypothetical protein
MGMVLCLSQGGVKWARFPGLLFRFGDDTYPYKACLRHAGLT